MNEQLIQRIVPEIRDALLGLRFREAFQLGEQRFALAFDGDEFRLLEHDDHDRCVPRHHSRQPDHDEQFRDLDRDELSGGDQCCVNYDQLNRDAHETLSAKILDRHVVCDFGRQRQRIGNVKACAGR